MQLDHAARDWYVVTINRTPVLTGTEQASFDGGITWIDGHATTVTIEGQSDPVAAWAWLLAGPDYDAADVGEDPADTDATITASLMPRHRIAADPVLDIDRGARITLV